MAKNRRNERNQGMMSTPADWREALQWFVNTIGLYSGSVRGLFLSDWTEELAVSLEAAVINLKSRAYNPFVIAGDMLYQQADFIFNETHEKAVFARPLASKVELEISGNDVLILDALMPPRRPSHIWYLLYYVLFPRIVSGKVTIITTPLPYAEFMKQGKACGDFDFCNKSVNWDKLQYLIQACTISQEEFKASREESAPPMLKAELKLFTALRERGLDVFPQHVLGDYLLDFALMQGERRLNIECDLLSAMSGHEINTREAKRDLVLLSDGWQILKFSSSELLNNTQACVDVVEDIWREGRKRSHCGRLLSGQSLPPCPELPEDDVQRSAIIFGGGPIALVGGSGTGKTLCLQKRAGYLLSQGISPDSILILSYSPDTARILKQSLETNIDKQWAPRLNVISFHDLGMKILKENISAIKRKPPLKLEPSPEKVIQKLLGKARKDADPVKLEMSGEIDEFYVYDMISMYKTHLISSKQAKEQAENETEAMVARVYQAYEEQLLKTNRIDRNDVFGMAVNLLLENAELRTKYQTQYEFILADEYQEVTVAQDMLARIIAAPQDNFFICGDEDETISEGKNACPELLADFTTRFPNGRAITMEHNWRCHPTIVEHAKWIISYLERSKIKKPFDSGWGAVATPAIFGPQACMDEAEDAAWTAQQVKNLIDAGRNAGDIAIVYRQNLYETMLEEELAARGVRFKASVSDSSVIPDELGDMLAFLKLVMDPDGPRARESFERVCQLGTKEIDPKLSATIASFAGANSLSYLKAVEIYAEATADHSCKELEQLVKVIRAMNNDRLPPAESIGYLRRTRRLNDYYKNIKVPPGQAYEPLKKLGRMEEEARKFSTVVEFVQHVEDRIGDYEDKSEEQSVHVKSVYDVKGSEFPIVFLVGLAEGIFPLANSADLEEERRLFYVAFTRAREGIYLSFPCKSGGKEVGPSRFLAESRLMANVPIQVAPPMRAVPAPEPVISSPPVLTPPVVAPAVTPGMVQPPVMPAQPLQQQQPAPTAHQFVEPAASSSQPHVQAIHSVMPQTPATQVPALAAQTQAAHDPSQSADIAAALPMQQAATNANLIAQPGNNSAHASTVPAPEPLPPRPAANAQGMDPGRVPGSTNSDQAEPRVQSAAASASQQLPPVEPSVPPIVAHDSTTLLYGSTRYLDPTDIVPAPQAPEDKPPELSKGLTPYVDNPDPSPARGMKKLPPSKNKKAEEAPPVPKEPEIPAPPAPPPMPALPPSAMRNQPYSPVPMEGPPGFDSTPPAKPLPGYNMAAGSNPAMPPPSSGVIESPLVHSNYPQVPTQPTNTSSFSSQNPPLHQTQQAHYPYQEAAPAEDEPLEGIPVCPSCSNPLEANASFCGECGYSLPTRIEACTGCSAPLEPEAKFCGECGTPVPQQPMSGNVSDAQEDPNKPGKFVKFLKFLEG